MKNAPEATPRWSAFFDVDGTLIGIKSMFSFLDYLLEQLQIADSKDVLEYRQTLQNMITQEQPREDINRFYYTIYANLDVELMDALGRDWYSQVRHRADLFFEPMLELVRWHQQQGASIVLISGSCAAILAPLAAELAVDHLIAAPLEVQAGRYTGRLLGQPTIGQGKATGLLAFIEAQRLRPQDCYAYGDDISDLPMLELVGHPTMVNPDAAGRHICQQRQWPIIEAV